MVALALGFTISACSSDSVTAPEVSAPLDLGQIIAEMRLPPLANVGVIGPTASAAISLPVLDGTSSITMRGVVSSRGVAQQVDMSMTSILSNIVQRSGSSGTSAWPRSGTITQDVVVGAAGLTSPLRTTITFNGTSKADVVITIAGVTQRCVVDMTSSMPGCN